MVSDIFGIVKKYDTMLYVPGGASVAILPEEVRVQAASGALPSGNIAKFCNFVNVGDVYYMYVMFWQIATGNITIRHYSGEDYTDSDIEIFPAEGDHKIYKYTSNDGITWTLVDTGSVYDKNGTEWLIDDYFDGRYVKVPVPYIPARIKILGTGSGGEVPV